ncbi:unnamed protein product, partial [Cyprideis torosa]
MRSSLSVILSSPAPDFSMSFPDYSQTAQDHRSLLILVASVCPQLKGKSFSAIYDRISKLREVRLSDHQNGEKVIRVAYRQSYPVENNEWGDFQAHRRLLGLISVGRNSSSASELKSTAEQHEALKKKFRSTLIDSRLMLFGGGGGASPGPSEPSSPEGAPLCDGEDCDPSDRLPRKNGSSSPSSLQQNGVQESNNSIHCHHSFVVPRPAPPSPSSSPTSQTVITPPDASQWEQPFSEQQQQQNGASLLLHPLAQSLRQNVERTVSEPPQPSRKRRPAPPPPGSNRAPSPNFPASPTARSSSSTAPLVYQSLDTSGSPTLEADIAQLVASLYWVLEGKRLERSLERPEAKQTSLLCAPFERKDFVGIDLDSRSNRRRIAGRSKKQLADLCLQAGSLSEALIHYQAAAEALRSVNDWFWLGGALEGWATASALVHHPSVGQAAPAAQRNASLNSTKEYAQRKTSLPMDLVDASSALRRRKGSGAAIPRHCLTPDELVDKYWEAIMHYGKFRHAGIIETEASLKAVHVLIEQQKPLKAAEFLQNVVFINLQLPEEEKIQRFVTLAELYHQIGFHRKAGFFKRVAALRCVSPQNPNPSWKNCYLLLLDALPGYKISLDPAVFPDDAPCGWPSLQTRLIEELIGCARRMGQHACATRHATFLLHAMLRYMSHAEKTEYANQLQALTLKSEGLPVPLALDNGNILPPVNLIRIPTLHSYAVEPLPPPLSPERMTASTRKIMADNSGVFIFSPIQLSSVRGERERRRMENRM